MFEIESVAIEARKQFFRAIACVIVSIKKTDDRMVTQHTNLHIYIIFITGSIR